MDKRSGSAFSLIQVGVGLFPELGGDGQIRLSITEGQEQIKALVWPSFTYDFDFVVF